MRTARILLATIGVVATAQGIALLLAQGGDNLRAALVWLVAGVLLHDGVLAPMTISLAAVATFVLRRQLPKPVIVGAIVLGTVSVIAVPVVGRFGARPDNPTLLDRDYTAGWLALATLTVVGVVVALLYQRRTAKGGHRGMSPGR